MRVVVTGANRGIGLELTRQLLARGETVVAAVRDPGRADALHALASPALRVQRLDVGDGTSVAAFAQELDGPVDLVINNAGVMGGPRQSIGDFDFADAARTYDVDALGPLRVCAALLPHVRRGKAKKLAHITSGFGSIGDNRMGGQYAYRMAKAALNMASRCLAVELRREGIISVVVNPGWVQTDMGGAGATTAVADSVRGVLRVIDGATLADSGEFLDWKGGRLIW
jgi:NAD(P)-dependent dehydrogenase (short-subunit alcohol dehydrogenase family)